MFESNTFWIVIGGLALASVIISYRSLKGMLAAFFLLLFAGAASLLIFDKTSRASENAAAVDWPTVSGRITAARIVRSWHSDDDGGGYYVYRPHIEFAYVYDDQPYTGNRLTTEDFEGDFESAHPKLLQYPVDQVVEVYVRPDDPSYAILEPGGQVWAFSLFEVLVGSFMLLIVSVVLFFIGLFSWKL